MTRRSAPRRGGCLLGLLGATMLAAAVAFALVMLFSSAQSVVVGLSLRMDGLLPNLGTLMHEDDPLPNADDIDESGLGFRALDDGQKVMYQQLLEGVGSLEKSFEVRGDPTDIDAAYHAVLVDHPELFWVDGSTHYSYYREDGPITLTPGLSVPLDQVEVVRTQIEQVANDFVASLPADADDYTKARLAYEYVINTTDYDPSANQNQNIQSVFLGHASVCAGYARAYQYLLQLAGVFCSFVEGTIASTGEDHAWNIVLVDGAYAYVDPTWGDPTYPGLDEGSAGVVYDYLGLTTAEILRDDHVFNDEAAWPACDSTAASYYAREGLVFSAADDPALSNAFWQQQAAGSNPVVFKFASEEAYAQARDSLLAGDFLLDDIRTLFEDQGRLGTSYQFQYSDALCILKLFL